MSFLGRCRLLNPDAAGCKLACATAGLANPALTTSPAYPRASGRSSRGRKGDKFRDQRRIARGSAGTGLHGRPHRRARPSSHLRFRRVAGRLGPCRLGGAGAGDSRGLGSLLAAMAALLRRRAQLGARRYAEDDRSRRRLPEEPLSRRRGPALDRVDRAFGRGRLCRERAADGAALDDQRERPGGARDPDPPGRHRGPATRRADRHADAPLRAGRRHHRRDLQHVSRAQRPGGARPARRGFPRFDRRHRPARLARGRAAPRPGQPHLRFGARDAGQGVGGCGGGGTVGGGDARGGADGGGPDPGGRRRNSRRWRCARRRRRRRA